ncbi:Uncharacterised protein [Bordetella pertussis]|nr:Uncharacterised protein [Bordetella pertussis]
MVPISSRPFQPNSVDMVWSSQAKGASRPMASTVPGTA